MTVIVSIIGVTVIVPLWLLLLYVTVTVTFIVLATLAAVAVVEPLAWPAVTVMAVGTGGHPHLVPHSGQVVSVRIAAILADPGGPGIRLGASTSSRLNPIRDFGAVEINVEDSIALRKCSNEIRPRAARYRVHGGGVGI